MDRTTISRNLKPLIDRGLIVVKHVENARNKTIKLTEKGYLVLQDAQPIWQMAVDNLITQIGKKKHDDMITLLKAMNATLEN